MNKLKWDKNFALEQAADDADLLEELIEIFKDSCRNDFRSIEKGIAEKDSELICGAAHSIKGASASLGIEGIRDVALEIESDSRNGSIAAATQKINELDELLRLLQQLK